MFINGIILIITISKDNTMYTLVFIVGFETDEKDQSNL